MDFTTPTGYRNGSVSSQSRLIEANRAAETLAKLLSKEFDVKISADDVVRLVRMRWETLSDLGHTVHRGVT